MPSLKDEDFDVEKLQNEDRDSTTTSASSSPKAHPVDKGWAWIIMIGSFGVHFLTIGYIRSFGILFVEFQNKYNSSSAMTSVISGVQCCSYSAATLIVMNVANRHLSVRQLGLMGIVSQFVGISTSSLVTNGSYLILTQGVLFGTGQALLYCPTMVILSQYFEKRRPIATVISTCGVSAGGIAFPLLTRYLVDTFGLRGGLLLLATAVLQQAVFVSFFTPPSHYYFASDKDDQPHLKLSDKEKDHLLNFPFIQEPNNSNEDCTEKDVTNIVSSWLKHNHSSSFSHDNNNHLPHSLPNENFSLSHTLKEDLTHLLERRRAEQDIQNSSDSISIDPSTKLPYRTPNTKAISSQCDLNSQSSHVPHDSLDPDPELKHLLEKVSFGSAPDRSVLGSDAAKNSTMRLRSNSESQSKRHNLSQRQISTNSTTTKDPHLSKQSLHKRDFLKDPGIKALSISSFDLYASLHSVSHTPSHHRDSKHFNKFDESSSEWEVQVEEQAIVQPTKRTFCRLPKMANTLSFWVVAVFFATGGIGSALPNVFIPPLSQEKGLDKDAPTLFLMVSAVTDLIGRLITGLVLHFGFMRPTTVVMAPMFACATLFQFTSFFNDFETLLALAIFSGFFTSAFWAMQSLVVIEVLGMENLGSALGFYSILVGFGAGISYPIGGALKDMSGTYSATFYYFGAMYYLAGACMFIVQFIKTDKEETVDVSDNDKDDVE